MAEPQRKYTSNIDPEIRPNLRVINGDGESTSARGNLSSVDSERVNDVRDGERNFQAINGGGESTSARGNLSSVDSLRDDEAGFVSNVTGNQNTNKSRFSVKGILGNKKWLASAGVTGVAGLAIAAFMALIPLKLEMFISNITQAASAVPGHAIEERTEHLITRALATRLLMKANGGMSTDDGKVAFCGGGGIACSLWLTYSSDYFEKKLGITFEADGRNRAKLGGKAQSWDIKASGSDGQDIGGIVQRITSHSEMRAFLKTEVKKNNNKNIVTRYIGRKILMKKYGVRNFNGPKKLEETRNSYANAKTRLKANVIANTVGKISPRVATYLTCLQGGATCAQVLRKSFTANGVDLSTEDPGEEPEGATSEEKENYKNQKAKYEAAKAANETIRSAETGESPTGEDNAAVKKFISSKVTKIAGGSVAGVGVLDLIFSAIGSIDNGALEEVWYDIAGQSYVGFAYEDVIVMNEKMKAGDMDMATLQAATELFDGAEESPLQQYENGSSTTATGTVTRKCATSDGEAMKTLSPGELVCPDNKVVRKYGEGFKNEAWWGALSTAAKGWNGSVGKIFDFAGEALGELMSLVPGFDKVATALGKALGSAMEWIIEKLFDPPSLGYNDAGKALGASNYDALSGAIRIAQNDTMLEGVSEDGTANGAGGQLLSSEEITAITNDYVKEEQEIIAKNSSGPAFLNPLVKGSLTQQLALMAPTSTKKLTTVPSRLLGAITPKTVSVSAATATNINPFGLPISGYTGSDGVFVADPKTYTEEYCTTSAKAREESFAHSKEVGISVYTKSDPCALEKMVVGAELISNGVYNDKYSLKDPLASFGGNSGAGADLTIMTYNIRRHALTDSSNRNSLVVNAIKAEQPDIIGFQEMDQVQVTAISSALPQYAKTSDKLGDTRRIFWNKEKFKKIRDGTWYSEKTEGSNNMPWVELEANGTRFYVFNLHTQPSTGESNIRLRAADGKKLINDVIPSVTNNDGKAVIVTGDMNSGYPGHKGNRGTEFYSVFAKNKTFELAIDLAETKTGEKCETAHSFGNQDCGKNNARHIDHIYISKNVKPTVSSWKNIADDSTKDASDHNPVIAHISIPGVSANGSESSSPASVTTEGYAFPVALSGLQSGITINQTKSTHWGGYSGFDLMSKDNTAVYAVTDGDITKVNRSYTFNGGSGRPCEAVTFKSKDGYYYWYGHIINSTTKTTGIKAGEKIAEVAGKSYGALCHGGGPHLHIDRNKSLSLAGSKGDPSFIPQLSKIYEAAGGK